jgi:hypothetical protein
MHVIAKSASMQRLRTSSKPSRTARWNWGQQRGRTIDAFLQEGSREHFPEGKAVMQSRYALSVNKVGHTENASGHLSLQRHVTMST